MMKRFLLPALAVAVLAGSAKAEDPSTATAWSCTSQTSESAKYAINGNELKKRDDDLERYEACRRKHPAPTPGRDDNTGGDAFFTDPCEPLDLQSYTFRIVSNNQYGIVAVSPEMGEQDDGSMLVAGRMMIIDKLTGHYVETLLSTPTPRLNPELKKQKQNGSGISVVGYAGTCDAIPVGGPKPIAGVPDVPNNPKPVVEEQKNPQDKSDTGKTHVHVHRHDHHYKHIHRHGHHYKHVHRHNHHPKNEVFRT